MTASRVVNGEPSVGASSREAVQTAIRELNYAPNLAARSLVTADEVRIGLICPERSSAFMSEVFVGVLDAVQAAGVHILLERWPEETAHDPEVVRRLVRGGASGVVLLPPFSESLVFRQVIEEEALAAAVVTPGRPVPDMICVRMDDRSAAYDVGRHLLELGHRRIGLIGGDPDHPSSHARKAGFEEAIAEASDAEVLFAPGLYHFASGLVAAKTLIDRSDRPTAIFASNDDMAAATLSIAHRQGLDVPRDLSVVGFDDSATAPSLWPPLTTIRQPVRAMAATAVELLARRIRARDQGPPADRVLDYALVVRQSAAPPGHHSA